LEFVEIGTLVEKGLDIAKEIVHIIHAFLILSVNEFAYGGFVADAADVRVPSFLFFEAVNAEEAVAVEYEFACLFEAGLAFISVLCILVHSVNIYLSNLLILVGIESGSNI
jgi:hypothetical protein